MSATFRGLISLDPSLLPGLREGDDITLPRLQRHSDCVRRLAAIGHYTCAGFRGNGGRKQDSPPGAWARDHCERGGCACAFAACQKRRRVLTCVCAGSQGLRRLIKVLNTRPGGALQPRTSTPPGPRRYSLFRDEAFSDAATQVACSVWGGGDEWLGVVGLVMG